MYKALLFSITLFTNNTIHAVIAYVSDNQNKVQAIANFLYEKNIEIPMVHYNVKLEEIEGSAEDIAIYKAKQAYVKLKKPVLVDEVSIFFKEELSFLEPYRKFSIDMKNFNEIIKSFSNQNLKSIFQPCMVYYDGFNMQIFHGKSKALISTSHIEKSLEQKLPLAECKIFICGNEALTLNEIYKLPIFNKYNFFADIFEKFLKWHHDQRK